MPRFFIFVFILALSWWSGASALSCRIDTSELTAAQVKLADQTLRDNSFKISRDLADYFHYLHPDFKTRVQRLSEKDHWLDAGAGLGYALIQHLQSYQAIGLHKAPQVTAVVFENHPLFHNVTAPLLDGRFAYISRWLSGRLLEDIPVSELSNGHRFAIITDFMGPISYSMRLSEVLQSYMASLDSKGSIFVVTATEGVRIKDNDVTQPLPQWLARQSGLKVSLASSSRNDFMSFKIEKTSPAEVTIPAMKLIELVSDKPPQMVFEVDPK